MTTETDNSLFSIVIDTLEEEQPRRYQRHMQTSHGDRMFALYSGKPQERLQESELAREIVRLMLDANKPIGFLGSDSSTGNLRVKYLGDYTTEQIEAQTYALMREGLLDHGNINGAGPRKWAFESELDGSYQSNLRLRDALRELLKPYEVQVGQDQYQDTTQQSSEMP